MPRMAANSKTQATDDLSFREAMADVPPRAPSDRLPPERRLPPPRARNAEADERAVLDEMLYRMFEPELIESGDTLSFRSHGIQDGVWRRLRRGQYRVGADLDLHGMNRAAAHAAVSDFLIDCVDRDIRCVRIVHGKGNRSPNTGPVIKTLLDGWLRKRKEVLAFCSTPAHDGGTGAVYVLLRAGGPDRRQG